VAAAETSPVMPRSSDACQTVIVRNVRWVVAKMLPAFLRQVRPLVFLYSYRSDVSGSTFVARRAGM